MIALLAEIVSSEEFPTPGVQDMDYGAALFRMFFALLVCLALVILTVWFLRRLMQAKAMRGNHTQMIRILEKRMLSPKSTLYVVEVEGEKVLLAESHLEIRRIHAIPQPKDEDLLTDPHPVDK